MKNIEKKFDRIEKLIQEELVKLLKEQEEATNEKDALIAKLEKMRFVAVLRNKKHNQAKFVKFMEEGAPGWSPLTRKEEKLLGAEYEGEELMWQDQLDRINNALGTNFNHPPTAMQHIGYGVNPEKLKEEYADEVEVDDYNNLKQKSFAQIMKEKKRKVDNKKQNIEAKKELRAAEIGFYRKVFAMVRKNTTFIKLREEFDANLLKNYKSIFKSNYSTAQRVMVTPNNKFSGIKTLIKNLGINSGDYKALHDLSLIAVSSDHSGSTDSLYFHTREKNFTASLIGSNNTPIVNVPVKCGDVASAGSPAGNKWRYLRAKMFKLSFRRNKEIADAKKQAIDGLRNKQSFAKWASKPFDQQDNYGKEDEYDRGVRTKGGSSVDFLLVSARDIITGSRADGESNTRLSTKEFVEETKMIKALQYEYDLWTQKVSIPGARLIDWRNGEIIDKGSAVVDSPSKKKVAPTQAAAETVDDGAIENEAAIMSSFETWLDSFKTGDDQYSPFYNITRDKSSEIFKSAWWPKLEEPQKARVRRLKSFTPDQFNSWVLAGDACADGLSWKTGSEVPCNQNSEFANAGGGRNKKKNAKMNATPQAKAKKVKLGSAPVTPRPKKNKNSKYNIDALYPQHNKKVAAAVKELQRYLGFEEEDIDGIFGPATTKAVRARYYSSPS